MSELLNEQYEAMIANSKITFMQGKHNESLTYAKQAIKMQPNGAEGYLCAGNAYMTLEKYDLAVQQYKKAVEYDPENGDRYFHLGYAQSANNQPAEGLATFAKADEIGCSPETIGQLYKIMGMLCFDLDKYADAVINLCKAETIIGIDMDILKRKALSYGMSGQHTKGLEVANQMKMFAPSLYIGYRIARQILILEKRDEEAEMELDRAKKFATPCADYFYDRLVNELNKFQKDKQNSYLDSALSYINDALVVLEPEVNEVIDCYINAAEVYVYYEDADMIISCLNASENPVDSYNSGFSIMKIKEHTGTSNINVRPSDREINKAVEDVRRKYSERDIERLSRENERSAIGERNYSREHLTPISSKPNKVNKLDGSQFIEMTKEKKDNINRLYLVAYTMKKDISNIKLYASKLANSENIVNEYTGKYSLVKALKDEGSENAEEEYLSLIRYLRNQSIKDPSDLSALSFRIKCLADLGQYDKAEKLCELLSEEMNAPLLEEIEKARAGGNQDDKDE